MDWNEDGKKDLVIGDTSGKISIFLNTGTDASPAFSGSTFLRLGASDFDCGSRSMPEIVDWNNDGKKDVLCGEDDGVVHLLINTGTNASPAFSTRVFLQDGAGTLDVGLATSYDRSTPMVVDWNGDGKKDLLSGRYDGKVVYYQNQGTDASPSFSGRTELQAGGSTIDVGYYARIKVCDWNNDGLLDLLAGNSDGKVYLFLATRLYARFARTQKLKVRSRLYFDDWAYCLHDYRTGKTVVSRPIFGPGTIDIDPIGRIPTWYGVFLYSYERLKWEEALYVYGDNW